MGVGRHHVALVTRRHLDVLARLGVLDDVAADAARAVDRRRVVYDRRRARVVVREQHLLRRPQRVGAAVGQRRRRDELAKVGHLDCHRDALDARGRERRDRAQLRARARWGEAVRRACTCARACGMCAYTPGGGGQGRVREVARLRKGGGHNHLRRRDEGGVCDAERAKAHAQPGARRGEVASTHHHRVLRHLRVWFVGVIAQRQSVSRGGARYGVRSEAVTGARLARERPERPQAFRCGRMMRLRGEEGRGGCEGRGWQIRCAHLRPRGRILSTCRVT